MLIYQIDQREKKFNFSKKPEERGNCREKAMMEIKTKEKKKEAALIRKQQWHKKWRIDSERRELIAIFKIYKNFREYSAKYNTCS